MPQNGMPVVWQMLREPMSRAHMVEFTDEARARRAAWRADHPVLVFAFWLVLAVAVELGLGAIQEWLLPVVIRMALALGFAGGMTYMIVAEGRDQSRKSPLYIISMIVAGAYVVSIRLG